VLRLQFIKITSLLWRLLNYFTLQIIVSACINKWIEIRPSLSQSLTTHHPKVLSVILCLSEGRAGICLGFFWQYDAPSSPHPEKQSVSHFLPRIFSLLVLFYYLPLLRERDIGNLSRCAGRRKLRKECRWRAIVSDRLAGGARLTQVTGKLTISLCRGCGWRSDLRSDSYGKWWNSSTRWNPSLVELPTRSKSSADVNKTRMNLLLTLLSPSLNETLPEISLFDIK
jgi:hypothetical protein